MTDHKLNISAAGQQRRSMYHKKQHKSGHSSHSVSSVKFWKTSLKELVLGFRAVFPNRGAIEDLSGDGVLPPFINTNCISYVLLK